MLSKILCNTDGGIGNRFGNIINALWLAEKFNCQLYINWPVTNWCASEWKDTFCDIPNVSFFSDIVELFKRSYGQSGLIASHETADWLIKYTQNSKIVVDNSIREINNYNNLITKIRNINPDWIFCNDSLPWNSIPHTDIRRISKKYILPNSETSDIINSFCAENKIDKLTTGIHIRGTDGSDNFEQKYQYYLRDITGKIKNGERIFICTDDRKVSDDLQNRFSKSIIIFPKNEYVEKFLPNHSWRGNTHLPDNVIEKYKNLGINILSNVLSYNVLRSKEQIKTAVCDLFILSKTSIFKPQYSCFSTFLNFADYLS